MAWAKGNTGMTGNAQYRYPDAIVETDWLEANLADKSLRIFDCTTHLLDSEAGSNAPYVVKSGRADYDKGHIPGSGFLDLQGELSVADSPFRFTVPSAAQFAAAMSAHGVSDETRVILYSTANAQWATRIWWMLRSFGFDNAAVLNGGWQKWQAEGKAVSTEPALSTPAEFTARPREGLFVGKEGVASAIGENAICTINALSPELHRGESARYGRPGCIPESTNIPAASLLNKIDNTFLDAATVAEQFTAVGASPDKQIITYCGGGIAATLDAFLLHQLGYEQITVYDNSMSEWASDETLPIELSE
jgi:thiosulfate/3-mercaptopyruvate sulfurtransferase